MTGETAPASAPASPAAPPPLLQEPREAPRPAASLAPMLSVDGFEGPLDGLLELARAKKIDLAKLSIVELMESFGRTLDAALATRAASAPLGPFGDWLVLAATLAWLRSRLLLPANAPEAKAALDEAEALRRHLMARARIATAADWLDRQPQLGHDVFARGTSGRTTPTRRTDVTDLLRACLRALRVPEDQRVAWRPRPKLWSVTDALARLRKHLAEHSGDRLEKFLPAIAADTPDRDRHCRAALASTLLASLELARTGEATLEQETLLGQIQIAKAA